MKPLPKFITIREAADMLDVSVQRVGQLVKAKKLGPAKKIQCGYRKIAHLPSAQVLHRALAVSPAERDQ